MSGRPLTHADKQVWGLVTRTVRPLAPKPLQFDSALKSYMHIAHAPAPILHKSPTDVPVRKDKQIRKGRVAYEQTIDLHDQTRDQAFPTLVNGLSRAHKRGRRCVLVITGKGPNLEGVLRLSLPSWLGDSALRPLIASYSQAHIRHGGAGAFYVFLKRKK